MHVEQNKVLPPLAVASGRGPVQWHAHVEHVCMFINAHAFMHSSLVLLLHALCCKQQDSRSHRWCSNHADMMNQSPCKGRPCQWVCVTALALLHHLILTHAGTVQHAWAAHERTYHPRLVSAPCLTGSWQQQSLGTNHHLGTSHHQRLHCMQLHLSPFPFVAGNSLASSP